MVINRIRKALDQRRERRAFVDALVAEHGHKIRKGAIPRFTRGEIERFWSGSSRSDVGKIIERDSRPIPLKNARFLKNFLLAGLTNVGDAQEAKRALQYLMQNAREIHVFKDPNRRGLGTFVNGILTDHLVMGISFDHENNRFEAKLQLLPKKARDEAMHNPVDHLQFDLWKGGRTRWSRNMTGQFEPPHTLNKDWWLGFVGKISHAYAGRYLGEGFNSPTEPAKLEQIHAFSQQLFGEVQKLSRAIHEPPK